MRRAATRALDDSGWGEWVNCLDALIRDGLVGRRLRLDSAVYWLRPSDYNPDSARFHDAVYPAKLWLTYSTPGLEITAGDSYVQFGRGLTLSMRKIDELGIDTTVRGLKVQMQRDPFAITAVAGFANPSHIDESSGRSLFPAPSPPRKSAERVPIFGRDLASSSAEIQAGRGLPITLGTRVVRFSRCAPYRYDANGYIRTSFFDDLSGVALGRGARRRHLDLAELLSAWRSETIQANDVTMLGQSIEVPNLGGHGKLYLEGATQYRHADADPSSDTSGNVFYGALRLDGGPLTTTIEIKSNRNFYRWPRPRLSYV